MTDRSLEEFVRVYYEAFDSNRPTLAGLYVSSDSEILGYSMIHNADAVEG